MPDWLTSILLGVIEGITEFLPVSSTGHLLLPQQLGWLEKQTDLFNIAIQSGAVIAVLFNFTDRVKQLTLRWREPEARDYLAKLLVAFVITGAGGLLIDKLGFHPMAVGELPGQLAALSRSNQAVQQMAVNAIIDGDKEAAFHAVALDPLTSAVLSLGEIRIIAI